MWRRLWLLGGLTFAIGCNCGTPDGALKVVIDVDAAQKATCVVLEVSDGSAVQATQEFERDRNQWVVGLKQGSLPDSVSLSVRGFLSASGCAAPRTFSGGSAPVSATFPKSGVETVTVTLSPPPSNLDADRDGFVAIAQGGADCNDADASIRPGAVELCAGSIDQDCDGAAACADTDCSATPACQRTPDRLAFVTPARTVAAGECSPVLTVEAQDAAGAAPAQQGLPVSLGANPATGVTFYADASCTQAASAITIAQGQTQASFHFRSTQGGTTFTASAAVLGLTSATQVQTVIFPAPTQLAFTTPPRTVAASACSEALSLELRDASGTATQAAQAVPVALSGAPATGLGFFLDSACTTPLAGGAMAIAAGATGATFYARGTTAGAIALTAASTGLTSAQQTLTVIAGAAAQIRFTSSAQGLAVGACSSPVVLTTQDANGNASPVGAATVATLSANPAANFAFYSDAACTSAITQVTVAQGASTATLYFAGTAPAVVQIQAATASLGNATQTEVIGAGPPAALAFTTAPQTVTAGNCSGVVTVQSQDASGFPSNVGSALVVALAASPASPLQFFSDSACSTAITQLTIAAATADGAFYFRSTLAGAVQLTASSSLPTPAQQTETIAPAAAVAITFLGSAQTVAAGACSAQLAVSTRDQFGNAVPMSATTPVALSSAPTGVSFFTDSGCATAVTQVNIGVGQSTAAFFARANLADSFTLTAQTAAQGSATQGFTVTAGAATQLAFTPAAQTVAAGACSAAVQVQRRDAFGNPVTDLASLAVALSSTAAAGLTFHSASDCNAPSAITSVDIPSNGSSAIFYVRATVAEVVTVTGAGGGLTDATHALTVTPAGAAVLLLTPAAQTVLAGDCTAAVQVQRRDAFGNPTTAGLLTVNLASNATSGLTFHSAFSCSAGSAITQVDIADGASTATFYVRPTVAEAVTVTASSTGLTSGTHALTVDPAAASQLTFSPAAQAVTAGVCSAAITVTRRDAFGNATTVGALTVTLSSNATGGLTFHSASDCSGGSAITDVGIAAGASSATFYVRATAAQVVTVTGSGGGLTPATHALTVNPAAATQLVFNPASQLVTAGACSAGVTVTRRDAFGNPTTSGQLTVGLSSTATSGLTFHTASDCSAGATVTSVDILDGASGAIFYVRATVAETVTVTGSGGGLTDATHTLTVNLSGPTQLVFTPAAQTVTAGNCSAVITVTRRDGFGNPTTSGLLTVALTSNATSGLTFHTAASCSGPSTVTSVDIANGSATATFYVRATVAQSVTVTGTGGGLSPATHALTVDPGPAAALVFTPAAQSATAGVCSALVTVTRRDAFGNPTTSGSLNVGLSSSATSGLTFHTASDCNGGSTVTQVNIADGQSAATFYLRATVAESVTVTGAGGGLTNATQALTVGPAAATQLVFTPAAQSVTAGACSAAITVTRRDALGNATTSGGLAVALSSTATSGLTFHTASDCNGGSTVTQVNIADGTSAATLYVRATVAGSVTVTGAGGGLTDATHALTVSAAAAAALVFTPAAQTVTAGNCSAQVTVARRDAFGNPTTSGLLTVALTSNATSGLTFHSAASCNGPSTVTGVDIANGSSTATFYVRATVAEVVTVTGAGGGLTDATHALTVTPAAATQLVFTPAAQAVGAGVCSAAITVTRRDGFGNPTTSGLLTVALTSSAASGLTFHTASDCSGGSTATSVDLIDGSSATTFYVRATVLEVVTVFGNGGGLTQATHALTVNAGPAASLTFTPAAQTVTAGVCSAAVTVTRRDQFNNLVTAGVLTVNLSSNATGGLTFHTAADCSGASAVTSVDIADGNSAATLYVLATVVEPVTVTGSATGLSNATHALTINPAAAAALVFTPAAQTVTAGVCSAVVTVTRRDAFGNLTTSGVTAVGLSSNASGGLSFHSASDCNGGSAITSVDIADAASSATFYVRATVVEPVTVQGTSTGLSTANHALTINPAAASQLVVTPAGQTVTAGACSAVVTVTRRDAFGNLATSGALAVGLSSTATSGLTFHSASDCNGGSAITGVNIADLASSATFYLRATVVEPVTVTATAAGVSDGTHVLTINPAAGSVLTFTPAAQTVTAGACSAVVTVTRRDAFGNLVTSGATPVALSSNATSGLSFHSASDCNGGSAITSVNIADTASTATFYLRATRVEAVTVTGSSSGFSDATHALTINPGPAYRTTFTSAPITVVPGGCSAAITVQQQDEFGNPVAVGTDTTVTLTDDGTGFDFHLAANCGDTATGTATITTGSSTTTFYVTSPNVGVVTMTATIAGLTVAGTQQATVATTGADHLAFTTPERTITSGDCSLILTVQRQDSLNNPVTGGGPLTVNLSSDATSGLTFWTDAACTASAGTSVQISGGNSSASFYVRALVAEVVTLTAAGGALTNATQTFTTNAGPATQLVFTSPLQSIPAGTCSGLATVEQRDANQNPVAAATDLTVTLADQAGAPAVTFYSDPACTTAVPGNQLTMGTGTFEVSFYFRGDAAGSSTITASAPSRTDGTQLATITPAPPTQLVFTPAAVTVEAGFCLALTLERRDAANQPTAPAAPTPIETLTVTPVVGAPRLPFQFFSDNTCTTTLAAPFNINGGASSTVVYVKGRSGSLTGTAPGNQLYTVTATATGLTNGTSGVTVNPMVRRRSAGCQITGSTQTCAIAPALTDISRTMLLFQASPSGTDENPSDDNLVCRLRLNGTSGNAEVFCERYGTGAGIDIEWQTVSFPYSYANGGVTVQHVTGSCATGATNTMPLNVTVSNAPLTESFVLMSHRSTGLSNDGNDFFTSELTSATNLRVNQSNASTTCNTDTAFAAQVVSWAGSSVARAVSAGGAGATFDVSQSTSATSRTFLLYSSRMTGDVSGTSPNPESICRRRLRGRIFDNSTLRFVRGCTGADVQDISWEHVLLPANTSVQGVQGTINAGANSSSITITQVDMTRAFAFTGGQGPGGAASGQTDYAGADRVGSALVRTVFSSATQVNLNRITTSGTGSWHVWTVQVDP